MSGCNKYYRGWWRAAGGLVLAGSWLVGCGSDFTASDCKATRTCGDPGSAGGEGGDPGSELTPGGAGGLAGSEADGGEGGDATAGCRVAADCSNGDPADGAEVCMNGTCQPGDAPPRVVSITPQENDEGAEPSAPVVIQFSETLDPATVTAETVQLLDGETPISGKLSYKDGVVTFVADTPLRLLASYQVAVSEAVTDAAGVALVEPFSSTFTVRDGAWHTIDIPGSVASFAETTPLSPSGSLLVAWSGTGAAQTCPGYAGWLALDSALPTMKQLVPKGANCLTPLTAGSGNVGAVSWSADGAYQIQQHREGEWESTVTQVTTSTQTWLTAMAVSPLGVVSRFELATRVGGVRAQRTNSAGVWQSAREELIPLTTYLASEISLGFDAQGNGFAVFVARDSMTDKMQIMVSHASASVGKWAPAQILPGTLSPPAQEGSRVGPAVAVAPTGEAMVVWFEDGRYVWSSYYDPKEGWFTPEPVGGSMQLYPAYFGQASVTYDGSQFVTAWIGAPDSEGPRVLTARYRSPAEGWSEPEQHVTNVVRRENPPIVSDQHGNLLLVWKVAGPDGVSLVQRRFVAGAWQPITPVADSTTPEEPRLRSVAMNESGIASILWPIVDANQVTVGLKVARFY